MFGVVMTCAFSCLRKHLMVLLFISALHVVPTEPRHGMFKVEKISPNSIYVARGEPLKLNVTLNGTNYRRYLQIHWDFRRSSSRSYESVLSIRWIRSHRNISMTDKRLSAVGDATLLLVNTTLNDSGTYMCQVFSFFRLFSYHVFYFNVTVEDEPKAEITCSQNIKLIERQNFSCWCSARGAHLVPTASWMKSGEIVGDPNDYGNELSLLNVSKNAAGTYICRAQLFSLMDEKTTEIKVHFSPRISYFQSSTSQNNSVTLTCLADGLPRSTYAIYVSNGNKVPGVENGVVVIGNHTSTVNATFTCVAENYLGRDERRLNIDLGLRFTDKERQQSTSCEKGTYWYIAIISPIVGIMVGVGLLYGCQRIRRWRATSTHQKTWRKAENHIQNDSAVSPALQHGTYPNSGIHLYDQPNLVTRSSADCLYQELNEARSKEEHGYQGLRLTTRMKRAVESTGQP